MKTVDEWITKLSKPYWMPIDPRIRNKGVTEAHLGPLNIMWVLMRMKPLDESWFTRNSLTWDVVVSLCAERIRSYPVGDYATIYSPQEFYALIKQHPATFRKHAPMVVWDSAFKRVGGLDD